MLYHKQLFLTSSEYSVLSWAIIAFPNFVRLKLCLVIVLCNILCAAQFHLNDAKLCEENNLALDEGYIT